LIFQPGYLARGAYLKLGNIVPWRLLKNIPSLWLVKATELERGDFPL
jgi:hypothetical protein